VTRPAEATGRWPDEAPGRVLLVEDNEVNQAMAILTRLGYHADVADNGQQQWSR
jgi:CheY-like chemotaxis protein